MGASDSSSLAIYQNLSTLASAPLCFTRASVLFNSMGSLRVYAFQLQYYFWYCTKYSIGFYVLFPLFLSFVLFLFYDLVGAL